MTLKTSSIAILFCGALWLMACGEDSNTPAPAPLDEDAGIADADDGGVEDEPAPPELIEPFLTPAQEAAALTISPQTMRDDMDFLASDELGGRAPASPGHARALEYIAQRAEEVGLVPMGDDGGFVWSYETDGRSNRNIFDEEGEVVPQPDYNRGFNVVGCIPGTDPTLSGEVVVYMAHYDHLGVEPNGDVFNGAFDDASGVAVGLEMARAIIEGDAAPLRTLVFLFTDEEEGGLKGAENWIANPTVPADKIVLGISGDPLGRRILPDYSVILMAGFERSPALLAFWRKTEGFAESDVVFVHRDAIPVFASDQDEFHAAGTPVPAAWFINPGMSFYHTTDDTPDTIDYRIMLDSARYMARSLIFAGNTNERFEYVGPPEIDGASAADFKRLPEGMLGSEVLNDDERQQIEEIIALADDAIEANSIDAVGNPTLYFFNTVKLLAFDLPQKYPGEVPPPFPGEE